MEDLNDASELLTPLKVLPSFKIHDDNLNSDADNDGITKIPHGLTAKKDRRKSYHPGNSENTAFPSVTKRAPLTSPRSNILNSFPINVVEGPKRQLFREFETLQEQNVDHFAEANISIHATGSKRKSSIFGDDGDISVLSKVQKVGETSFASPIEQKGTTEEVEEVQLLDEDDFILIDQKHTVIDRDEDDVVEEREELSRIELENDQVLSSGFDTSHADNFMQDLDIQTQDDLVQNVKESEFIEEQVEKADVSTQTPLRVTEPVALSPKTEQHSRVANESNLLLDTSKSPNLDDSYVAESPLSHNASVVHNHSNVLDDLDLITESSPQKPSNLPPAQRPLFTIKQVHEIQNDFKKEVEKLEQVVREKSSTVVSLNDAINQFKNVIYNLEDQVEFSKLAKINFEKERELLRQENEVYENDIKDLNAKLRSKDDKLHRSKHAVDKFKQRIDELNLTILAKDNSISDLTDDIESKARAIDILNSRVADFEDQASRLHGTLSAKIEELDQAYNTKAQLELNILELKNELGSKIERIESLQEENDEIKSANDGLRNQNNELLIQKASSDELISQMSQDRDLLSNEISILSAEYLALKKENLSCNFQELEMKLEAESKKLLLKDAVIAGLTGGSSSLKLENESLRAQIQDLQNTLQSMEVNVADTQELLIIRKAEVDELNIEIQTFKDEVARYTNIIDDQNQQIKQFSQVIQEQEEAAQAEAKKAHEFDLLLQKQESDHLSELEAFHSEMSNVQSLVNNKSNELYELKEQTEALSKENGLLKYEIETFKDDAISSEQRISNLKSKLNEAKAHNESLESQVSQVSQEKAMLEVETDKRLQQLAEDLYIQYSKKHEQKVQVLKKGYENKWSSKIAKFENENIKLKREIEGLNSQLDQERAEKNEIIKLWDAYKNGESS
jgi:chromosome segregation ATPase